MGQDENSDNYRRLFSEARVILHFNLRVLYSFEIQTILFQKISFIKLVDMHFSATGISSIDIELQRISY